MTKTLAPDAAAALPTIRTRLANALLLWSLAWGLCVGAAVWLAATHEVDEVLDQTLQSAASVLSRLDVDVLEHSALAEAQPGRVGNAPIGRVSPRLDWQVVSPNGRLRAHSPLAPPEPWHRTPNAGFSKVGEWRVHGVALGPSGNMLYVAQVIDERDHAGAEVALSAMLAAVAIGLIGHLWLRRRATAELRPLQRLSDRLADFDLDDEAAQLTATSVLEAPERRELVPVHDAINALAERLALRAANERAFSAHAAHALRTPLAGIDTQLAMALRQSDPGTPQAPLTLSPENQRDLHQRLQRIRNATTRLQTVVAALLGLLRSGGQVQRQPLDLGQLMALLPTPRLSLRVDDATLLDVDPDLVAAALLNLLDNAERHGARSVHIDSPAPGVLRLQDDGPGVSAARLQELRTALDLSDDPSLSHVVPQPSPSTGALLGLGLMLADRVARAHGGALKLPTTERGFAVEMRLAPAA